MTDSGEISISIPENLWADVQSSWKEVEQCIKSILVTKPDSNPNLSKCLLCLNKNIFNNQVSTNNVKIDKDTAAAVSIDTFNDLLIEIENDVKNDETNHTDPTSNTQNIPTNVKQFIQKPV